MREFLTYLIKPISILWIGLFFLVFFYLLKKKRIFHIIALFCLGWLFVITTPFLPNLLINKLESQYITISNEKLEELNGGLNILVLGGGFDNDKRLPANDQLSETSMVRLSEGIRLSRILPKSKLITSGWGRDQKTTIAEVVARTAILLGVDSSLLKLQKKPSNTWEEATEYKRLFGESDQLILVTSAVHMPRAMYLFQKAGLNPFAAPTNHLVKLRENHNFWFWTPSHGNIRKMDYAIHEYLGLLWYRLGGK